MDVCIRGSFSFSRTTVFSCALSYALLMSLNSTGSTSLHYCSLLLNLLRSPHLSVRLCIENTSHMLLSVTANSDKEKCLHDWTAKRLVHGHNDLLSARLISELGVHRRVLMFVQLRRCFTTHTT